MNRRPASPASPLYARWEFHSAAQFHGLTWFWWAHDRRPTYLSMMDPDDDKAMTRIQIWTSMLFLIYTCVRYISANYWSQLFFRTSIIPPISTTTTIDETRAVFFSICKLTNPLAIYIDYNESPNYHLNTSNRHRNGSNGSSDVSRALSIIFSI